MITRMKKLSLLLYHRQRNRFLDKLQDLGVVHVVTDPEVSSDHLREVREKLQSAQRTLAGLKARRATGSPPAEQQPQPGAEELVERFRELEQRADRLDANLQAVSKDIASLSPWGDFEPSSIEALRKAGITVRFVETTRKKLQASKPGEATIEIINEVGARVYLLVLERGEKAAVEGDDVSLPARSLSSAEEERRRLQAERRDVDTRREELAAHIDVLEAYLAQQEGSRALESARLSMEEAAAGKVLSVSGWVPAEKQQQVAEFLDGFPSWYAFEEATREDDVPVLLRNNRFNKLFEPITKIFQLPHYFEIDPTFAIAPFFAMFFGNCLGDAGYGLVLLVAATIIRMKLRGTAKLFAALVQILGGATLIMGLINTGVGFGVTFADHPDSPLLSTLSSLVLIKEGQMVSPFNFALLVGIVQMTFGMILNIYKNARYYSFRHALPGLGRILLVEGCILLFLILYQKMEGLRPLLGAAFAAVGLGFAVLVYVAFFTELEQYLGSPIPDLILKLYFVLSGAVGDILSYIRLFALGLSSGVLGYVVNVIGLQMRDAVPVIGWVIFFVFLVVGHGANLVLACLGSFVHPLRLTFVEFYNNFGFKGGGSAYRPLSKTS